MKKVLLYRLTAGSLLLLSAACTKNFDSINTDPAKASPGNFDPNYLFTTAQLGYGNITEFQLYELSCMTQQLSSTFDYYGGGDKYNQQLTAYNSRFFTDGFNYAGQLTEALSLGQVKNATQYGNLIQMSRIMRVLVVQRITDIYGDIPYSEAGQAKVGLIYPRYDKQSDIYPDLLATLDDAINKLDPGKPLATGDLLYNGDISKWKKLGYSIMLRVAMRVTKSAPALAQQYAEKAAGKTFADASDNAVLKLDGGPNDATINRTANAIRLNDFQQLRWSSTLINYLVANNDPRLYALTEKADTGLAFNDDLSHPGLLYTTQKPATAGFVNEVPKGMPNGYDIGGAYAIANAPAYPGATGTGDNANPLGNYARPRLSVFTRQNLPVFLVTYAQTELLLAEAKARGWQVGAVTAAQHFRNGVNGSLQALPQWDAALTIPADSISNFLRRRALDESSRERSLQMINSEYWLASLFDFAEAWSNWRRSNYPVLTPVRYPGSVTGNAIPRRLPYPATENTNNPAGYSEALKRLGGSDLPDLRVWWDKE